MSLQFCPPEIQAYIFELACLDDGVTAQSLCLTSHYLRSIAETYLLQSLAISGPKMISKLAEKLENTPFYKRQLRHLFISDQHTSLSKDTPPRKSVPPMPGTRDASDPLNSIMRILTLAASTLESLTFVCATPHIATIAISRLFRTSFPRLRHLTVSGFYSFPTTPGKFPVLERLHLHGNRNPHGLLQGGLEVSCPKLKELKVSGLNMAVTFAMEVKEALAGRGKVAGESTVTEKSGSLFPSILPSSLRRLELQPGPDMSAKSSIYAIKDGLMMDALASIEPVGGVEVAILPRAGAVEMGEALRTQWSSS